MDITNINLGACPLQYLSIGYVGETGARPVAFDFSAWATEYGAGVLQLLFQRPGDAEPYPVVLDIDGTTATWTPDATDTAAQGQGQAQLVYTVSGVIVKNAIFRVLIAPSLGASGDPPEPYEDWLERLLTIAAETQQSALDAAESAEAAGTSADLAAAEKTAAETAQTGAEAAKTGAEAAEQTAQQAAALARAKAAEAAEAARIAGREADYAQQQNIAAGYSAESAHDDAERAAQSEEDAQTASSAARLASDAAETFADNAEAAAAAAAAAVTEVESKGAQQITAIGAAGTEQIQAVAAAGTEQIDAVQEKGEEVIASIPSDYTELTDEVSDLKSSLDTKAPAIMQTVGPTAIASFADGAEDMPLKSLTADIPVTQEGSGDPSPENVRPFRGWTGVEVERTGKNLFDRSDTWMNIGAYYVCDLPAGKKQKLFMSITGNDTSVELSMQPFIGFVGSDYAGGSLSSDQYRWVMNKGVLGSNRSNTNGGYTVTDGPMLLDRVFVYSGSDTLEQLLSRYNIAVYTEDNVQTFTPYVGTTIPIIFPASAGTVYGCTLTINADGSGELTVTHRLVDLGALSWTYVSSRGFFESNAVSGARRTSGVITVESDIYKGEANSTAAPAANHIKYNPNSSASYLHITDTRFTDAADFKAALTGHYAVAWLTEAQYATYQLTAEQIRTLKGDNNIWSDAGTVTAVYPADTKSYIDKSIRATRQLIAGIEAGMTASRAYSVGELLIVGDALYRVVAAIASGATLTPGTNVTATTVAEQLLLLANL